MKKEYFKVFILGVSLILVQSYFQYNNQFWEIINNLIDVAEPFIYAIFIAILMSPIVNILEKKLRLNRIIAISIAFIIVFAMISGFFLIVIPNLITSLTDFVEKFPTMVKDLSSKVEHILEYLKNKNLIFFTSKELEQGLTNFIKTNFGNFKNLMFGVGAGVIKSIVGLATFLIGVFISLYLMYSKEYFIQFTKNILSMITTEEKAISAYSFIKRINDIFLKFIVGRVIVSIVVGLIVFIFLLIAKVPYALLCGVLVGIGNMIPYVGSIVSGVTATFLVIIIAPSKIIFLFMAIGIAQAADGFLIGPKIMQESVGMSSFWTIISVIVCGKLFGPVGMFLGVPIFVVIKYLYTERLKKGVKE